MFGGGKYAHFIPVFADDELLERKATSFYQ
jgi:hypothetical protein